MEALTTWLAIFIIGVLILLAWLLRVRYDEHGVRIMTPEETRSAELRAEVKELRAKLEEIRK